jgi:hypothetical protein
VFPATLPFDGIGLVAFVHVDCDQYQCARAAIECLLPLRPAGGVMLFDDYGATDGATAAVDEAFLPREIKRTAQGKAFFAVEDRPDGMPI